MSNAALIRTFPVIVGEEDCLRTVCVLFLNKHFVTSHAGVFNKPGDHL